MNSDNFDVKTQVVDNKTSLCEVTNGLGIYYYYQPNYGSNVNEAHVVWLFNNKNKIMFF